ncbi:glycosyltransferase family 25 protein [Lacipirellula parvula]|nr:glycosyltransferase family 25 protein [Lacipirellula parvula]
MATTVTIRGEDSSMGQANSSLRETFDRVVCINLDRRPDRWKEFIDQLSAIEWPFADVQRFRAIDGDRVGSPDWVQCGNGAWGCFMSHLRILEEALLDGVTSLLILEDDLCFAPDFRQRAMEFLGRVPSNWDGLLLGGQHLMRPHYVSDGVVRVLNGNRTHAHALQGRYIRAAYQHLCNFAEHLLAPSHHVDHRLGTLHLRGDYNIYAPNPWLVGQAAGSSDITGREESFRKWDNSIRVPSQNEPQLDKNALELAERIPLIVLMGPYRSGCGLAAGVLSQLGGYRGNVDNPYMEDRDLRDLCRSCFTEPALTEHVPSRGRVRLLRNWLSQHRLDAARRNHPFAIVKHPLLSLMGRDLVDVCKDNVQFVSVQRALEESVRSLQAMEWPTFRVGAKEAQERLLAARDTFLDEHKHHVITFDDLRGNPMDAATQLADIAGVIPTEEQLKMACAYVNASRTSAIQLQAG